MQAASSAACWPARGPQAAAAGLKPPSPANVSSPSRAQLQLTPCCRLDGLQRARQQWQWRRHRAAPSNGGSYRLLARAADSQSAADLGMDEAQDTGQERRFLRALLLAFFASQNRSLFAAKCLVEVVVEMYREGVSVDDVAVMLSLASLQQGGKLLNPLDEDVLLSWVATIMIALQMVGLPRYPQAVEKQQRLKGEAPAKDSSRMSLGLQGLVRMAVDKFLSGTDLYRLQLQQSMSGEITGDAAGESPSVRLLQQSTRLVIIALEVVREMGLHTDVPLHQPPPVAEPQEAEEQQQEQQQEEGREEQQAASSSGSSGGGSSSGSGRQQAARGGMVVPGFMLACDPVRLAKCGSKEEQQRAAAVRLLISFMGAASGWLYPAWDYVEHCTECYTNGWAAAEVYSRLQDEEFAQSGGVLPIGIARLPGNNNVSATVFGRWLSLVFMTLAQLGVVHPGADEKEGWAWVSDTASTQEGSELSTLEAYGLADFVLHTIRNEERKEQGGGSGDCSPEAPIEGVLMRLPIKTVEEQEQEGFLSIVTIEDPSLLSTSPTALVMSQQISLVQMTRQLVLHERARAAPLPA